MKKEIILKTIDDNTIRCGNLIKDKKGHYTKMNIDLLISLDTKFRCPACKQIIPINDLDENMGIWFSDFGHGVDVKISTTCNRCRKLLDFNFKQFNEPEVIDDLD